MPFARHLERALEQWDGLRMGGRKVEDLGDEVQRPGGVIETDQRQLRPSCLEIRDVATTHHGDLGLQQVVELPPLLRLAVVALENPVGFEVGAIDRDDAYE